MGRGVTLGGGGVWLLLELGEQIFQRLEFGQHLVIHLRGGHGGDNLKADDRASQQGT